MVYFFYTLANSTILLNYYRFISILNIFPLSVVSQIFLDFCFFIYIMSNAIKTKQSWTKQNKTKHPHRTLRLLFALNWKITFGKMDILIIHPHTSRYLHLFRFSLTSFNYSCIIFTIKVLSNIVGFICNHLPFYAIANDIIFKQTISNYCWSREKLLIFYVNLYLANLLNSHLSFPGWKYSICK